jgi:hypothetical protein
VVGLVDDEEVRAPRQPARLRAAARLLPDERAAQLFVRVDLGVYIEVTAQLTPLTDEHRRNHQRKRLTSHQSHRQGDVRLP